MKIIKAIAHSKYSDADPVQLEAERTYHIMRKDPQDYHLSHAMLARGDEIKLNDKVLIGAAWKKIVRWKGAA